MLSRVEINTAYSMFNYQDENEDENQSFRSLLYVLYVSYVI